MEARFTVDVGVEAPIAFAQLSGDWNPLHTKPEYAARTPFGRPVLHGAYMTGLMSRLAGMYLPGEKCLLHGVSLRFIAPVQPPVTLNVIGTLTEGHQTQGRVSVRVVDAKSGVSYAEGYYDFGLHTSQEGTEMAGKQAGSIEVQGDVILVTGASGGLGQAVLNRLEGRALGVSRSSSGPAFVQAATVSEIEAAVDSRRLSAIMHCAWPSPDNEALIELTDVRAATEFNLAAPVREMIELAQLLRKRGTKDAILVLVGSTAAEPGRHNYRMPLYTLSKSIVPSMARVLATELAATSQRCLAVVFDIIEGGMNKRVSPTARAAHRDRSPFGRIPSPDEAAGQLLWTLQNQSFLASGSTLVLTGAAAP